ncbi:hypothetical protein AWW66_24940 [Micromonospora rosaria]|uniref:Cold-shock protein n=1 Tax=Micromonospora rosaria TaxID=47874 RepID=A0A136PLR4_9ACTN|nr:hypothetical protein [Micromonospora rosaria]KXK59321.1 hypothetical protein AWW66_24940 [Micromonospora rosaria]
MTTLSGVRAAAVVLPLLLLTAACAQQNESASDTGSGETSYPADAVVLRVDHTGGFVTPAMLAGRLPTVSVYGDGRVITQGSTTMIYPGPALPNLQVATLSAEEVAKLVDRARAAGVGSAADLGQPPVADAPSTRFTLRGATGTEETEVYALAEAADADTGLTADQRAARDKLRGFAESLGVPTAVTDQAAAPATKPYTPTAIAAIVEPWVDPGDGLKQPEVAWPGPALPGAALGTVENLTCVTVTGTAVQQVLDAAASASQATPWTSGGKSWTVHLRPLLPDETDCGDLASAR